MYHEVSGLGVQLLERTNKSVRLTHVGKAIVAHAENILREMKTMREQANAAKDPYSGEIHIGIIPTVAPYLLPLIIPQLSNTFPHLTYYLLEAQTSQILEELNQGKLDTAILALPITDDHLTAVSFFEEIFLLGTPINHPLARRKIIQETDLSSQQLLLLDEGHCLGQQALQLCQKTNDAYINNFRATSLETLRHMVAAGVGITLIPKLARRDGDGLAYLSFSGKGPSRSLGLVWRKSTPRILLLNRIALELKKLLAHQ